MLFVVDASDVARLDEAREVLQSLLQHQELTGIPLLVFANKNDLLNASEASEVTPEKPFAFAGLTGASPADECGTFADCRRPQLARDTRSHLAHPELFCQNWRRAGRGIELAGGQSLASHAAIVANRLSRLALSVPLCHAGKHVDCRRGMRRGRPGLQGQLVAAWQGQLAATTVLAPATLVRLFTGLDTPPAPRDNRR